MGMLQEKKGGFVGRMRPPLSNCWLKTRRKKRTVYLVPIGSQSLPSSAFPSLHQLSYRASLLSQTNKGGDNLVGRGNLGPVILITMGGKGWQVEEERCRQIVPVSYGTSGQKSTFLSLNSF